MKILAALGLVALCGTSAWAYLDPGTGVTFAAGIGGLIWGFCALILGVIGLTVKKWWAFLRNLFRSKKT